MFIQVAPGPRKHAEMREKLTVFRVIFIAVSRAISPYTVQKPCNSAVFFQLNGWRQLALAKC